VNISGHNTAESWEILPARYANNKLVIKLSAFNPTGFKMSGARLAESVGGKWVHRYNGYTVSVVQSDTFLWLFRNGWDAKLLAFRDQKPVFEHPSLKKENGLAAEFTLKEVKSMIQSEKGWK
jgi:hypothetical protein